MIRRVQVSIPTDKALEQEHKLRRLLSFIILNGRLLLLTT